jgi:uncharacterized coiled-coil protein SlyX
VESESYCEAASSDVASLARIDALNQRVISFEEKLCFQDELLEVLNQQLSQQQITILSLELRVQQLQDSVRTLSSAGPIGSASGANEPPPHY